MSSRPTRTATPARTRKTEDPEAAEPCRRADRARRHRGAGARPGAGDPGLAGQAVPDPLRIDGADPRRRPAGARQPLPLPLHRSVDRRHRRLPPARRRRRQRRRLRRHGRRPAAGRSGRALSEPTKGESEQNFIKRIVAGPGDRLSVRDGHPVVNGVEKTDEPYIRPCGSGSACNLPKTITIPADHYFMMGDNRGESDDSRFWGPVPRDWLIGKAFATYWPPDRVGIL